MESPFGNSETLSGIVKRTGCLILSCVNGRAVCLSGILLVGSTGSALAYIDFGVGSMLIQLVLGGIAGGIVIAKFYWGEIKKFFKKLSGGNQADEKSQLGHKEGQE